MLLQNQRLTELDEITQKFAELLDVRAGMVAATVTTARSVPENARQELQAKLVSVRERDVGVGGLLEDPTVAASLLSNCLSTAQAGSAEVKLGHWVIR